MVKTRIPTTSMHARIMPTQPPSLIDDAVTPSTVFDDEVPLADDDVDDVVDDDVLSAVVPGSQSMQSDAGMAQPRQGLFKICNHDHTGK